ncbi:hypothetical protein ZWY2020_003514 [Hordeum vulgare]|nr:hypothetical protein ZWY2020_003514 [Hordeum vulgare]
MASISSDNERAGRDDGASRGPAHPSKQRAMASTTESSCTTQTVQGTHRFQICQFSYGNVGSEDYIRSGIFRVGGFDWVIVYCPDADGDDGEEYISVYLELMSKYAEALAFVDLRLINQVTGDACTICAENRVPNQFKSSSFKEASWGREKFISKRALKDSGYIRDNRFVIECVVTVVCELKVSENKASCEIEVPPPNALEHFGKMLKDKSRADVTFKVGGEMFPAHRAVLAARSPILKAQLSEHMKENKMRHIAVDRMEPVVFEAMLHFIYTDSLPTMDDLDRDERNAMVQHLFAAADRYGLERLKLMCERILCLNLDVDNVAVALRLADRHDCQKLKEACVDFLVPSERIDAVLATRRYESIKLVSPSPLADLWEKTTRPPKRFF